MKVKSVQTLSNIKDLDSLVRYVSQFVDALLPVINGGINLTDNCDTQDISVTFPAAATEVRLNHSLGRIPTRFIVTSNSSGVVPYNGVTAATTNTFYLQATGAGTLTVILE